MSARAEILATFDQLAPFVATRPQDVQAFFAALRQDFAESTFLSLNSRLSFLGFPGPMPGGELPTQVGYTTPNGKYGLLVDLVTNESSSIVFSNGILAITNLRLGQLTLFKGDGLTPQTASTGTQVSFLVPSTNSGAFTFSFDFSGGDLGPFESALNAKALDVLDGFLADSVLPSWDSGGGHGGDPITGDPNLGFVIEQLPLIKKKGVWKIDAKADPALISNTFDDVTGEARRILIPGDDISLLTGRSDNPVSLKAVSTKEEFRRATRSDKAYIYFHPRGLLWFNANGDGKRLGRGGLICEMQADSETGLYPSLNASNLSLYEAPLLSPPL